MLEDAKVSLVLTTGEMQSRMEPIARAAGVRMHVMGAGTPLNGSASWVSLSTALALKLAESC